MSKEIKEIKKKLSELLDIKEGELSELQNFGIPIDDADGYPIVFEGVIKDISELNNIMDKHKNQNKDE